MGAVYTAAASATDAGSIPHAVCNTTVQCMAIDPNMACSNNLCVCPFSPSQPVTIGDGLCNIAVASLFPLPLGAVCTADANCSSPALCVAGQCGCPPGFQPWDEHNCTAIPQTIAPSSWVSLQLLLPGFVVIILFVVWFCTFTQGNGPRWAKAYIGGKESVPTLHVWSQASMGDQTPSAPMAQMMASQNTESVVTAATPRQIDSDLFCGGSCSPPESWTAAIAERSSDLTNQMTSMTEQRGLFSAPDESFVRPVLSGDEMYAKYPHLRFILSSTSSSTATVPAERPSTAMVPYRTDTPLSASRQTTLLSSKSRKRPARSESPSRRVAFPDEPAVPPAPAAQPESESEQHGQRSSSSQVLRRSSTGTPWSTFGSSLDTILSTPVVARVCASASRTDDATSHAASQVKGSEEQHTLSTTTKSYEKASSKVASDRSD
ncbi:hypothetical protein HPB50_020037 [Hyalomma asiaticum]|uniref:Uncharacterized protein n=1 Tax=Hyalomma asiaticum TaxID=266040 RepID=A0ACB7SJY9_HYAAI|nr:hypothetical protein HPB50_020037 [Hyalomma asiaticum]